MSGKMPGLTEPRFGGDPAVVGSTMYNPFDDQKPVQPRFFVGRAEIIDKIVGSQSSGSVWKLGAPNSFQVVGQDGIGKTSLLQYLDQYLKETGREAAGDTGLILISIYVDLNMYVPIPSIRFFFKDILAAQISRQIKGTLQNGPDIVKATTFDNLRQNGSSQSSKEDLEALSGLHFKDGVRALNEKCGEMLRLVCLLDGADAILSREWGLVLLKNLRSLILDRIDIPDVLALVLAWKPTRQRQMATRSSGLEGNVDTLHLSSLSFSEVRELANRSGVEWLSEEMAKHVYLLTGGQPRLTQYMLMNLWSQHRTLDLNRIDAAALEASHDSDIEAVFWRWTKSFDDVAERIYLFLAARSLTGNLGDWFVTQKELVHDLGLKIDEDISFALNALVSTGVIAKWQGSRFGIVGTIFRDWFLREVPQSYFQNVKMLATQPSGR